MRSAKERTAKYKAKTDAATVRRKVAAMLPHMMAAYAAHAREIVLVEQALRDVLDRERVVLDRFLYQIYAKQLWKCRKKCSSAALVIDAQSKKDGWRARGLDDRVLRKLAFAVFGISLA